MPHQTGAGIGGITAHSALPILKFYGTAINTPRTVGVQDCIFAVKAGSVTKCSDRILRVDPVAARCYAPGFHQSCTLLHPKADASNLSSAVISGVRGRKNAFFPVLLLTSGNYYGKMRDLGKIDD